MSGNEARLKAIATVVNYQPISEPLNFAETSIGNFPTLNVFNGAVMKQCLPKAVYKSLMQTIKEDNKLNIVTADTVASAMKNWAIEKGATHCAHVFYPPTGSTAEKHDSFLSFNRDGDTFAEFSDKKLIQDKPDTSHFPTGSIRFAAWGVTNLTCQIILPAFVFYFGGSEQKETPIQCPMKTTNTNISAQTYHTTNKIPQSTSPEPNYLLLLFNLIRDSFNISELNELCLEMNIKYEDLSGTNLGDKVRELVYYCRRHQLLPELLQIIKDVRPKLKVRLEKIFDFDDWQGLLWPG
ncbi:MAG: glutamine synthetase III [Chloroflexi bacterium]|nr:glutamine synthetase III [Chloroflexota bacterium]